MKRFRRIAGHLALLLLAFVGTAEPLAGEHYLHSAGLQIFADGKRIAFAESLEQVTGPLPDAAPASETTAGWRKFEGNPVLGGKLGACFDVAVMPLSCNRRSGRFGN